MKYPFLTLTLFIFGLVSCNKYATEKKNILTELYNESQLKSAQYAIDPKKDTTLVSANGTVFKVYANSFVTQDGAAVTGNVNIEIKEAFRPIDFVLGNLTTTSNGKVLQSGGMIYINASSEGKDLVLNNTSEIGVIVPTTSLDEGMQIFSGQREDDNTINWDLPKPILNSKLREIEESYITITYQYSGDFNKKDTAFKNWLWKADRKVGDKTTFSGVKIKVVDISKDFVALKENVDGLFIPEVITQKGKNGYIEDYNTSYIFSVKKLGWANIDKLYDDPAASEVNMIAKIENQKEFGYVFTTLILPNEKMHIPGYQKADDSFGFTQDDGGKLILPVGAKAILLATAYKDNKPYFSLTEVVVGPSMDISVSLTQTTAEGLKKVLQEKI